MNKRTISIILAILAVVLGSIACGFSASTANIKDAYLASDSEGTQKTTTFTQDDVFYCLVTLANAPDDTVTKTVWYAVEAENTEPNFMIDEVSITQGDGPITFNLANNNLWPFGKYKVELYLNDKLDRTLEFEVR